MRVVMVYSAKGRIFGLYCYSYEDFFGSKFDDYKKKGAIYVFIRKIKTCLQRLTFILHWFYKIVETKTRKENPHNNNGNDVYDETIDICDHSVRNDIGHHSYSKLTLSNIYLPHCSRRTSTQLGGSAATAMWKVDVAKGKLTVAMMTNIVANRMIADVNCFIVNIVAVVVVGVFLSCFCFYNFVKPMQYECQSL